jgi:hypothetical protein
MRWWIDSIMGSQRLIASTGSTSIWPFYASANYLQDIVEVGTSGNVLLLGSNPDNQGGNWDQSAAMRVFGDVARQDPSFASAYGGIDAFRFVDETIQDANVLTDGRPIWSTTEPFGSSWVPIVNVTRSDGSGVNFETWESGSSLAEKMIGSDYINGWIVNGFVILPAPGGGAVAVYEIYKGNNGASDIVIVEWTSSGLLASTFGGDGWTRIGRDGVVENPYEAILMADGRIAVLGRHENSCAVWMVKRDGTVDTSWDNDGLRTFGSRGCIARGAEEDGAGGLFVTGADVAQSATSNSSAFITHLKPSGATDATFGTSGYVWVRTAGVDYLMDICKTKSGVLVAAGQSSASSRRGYASGIGSLGLIAVVSASGKATSTFGGTVSRQFALGGQNDYFISTECMSDGSVMIGGQSILRKADGADALWSLILKINVKP